MFIITLIMISLVFLQTSFLPVNLLLSAVFAHAVIKIDKSFVLTVFIVGLLFDILNMRLAGSTSLFYLIVCLFLFLYQKKIKTRNLFYVLIFGLIVFLIYNLIFYNYISWIGLILEVLGLYFWYYVFSMVLNKNIWLKN